MMNVDISYYDAIPGETFFVNCLQNPIVLSVKNKVVKRGRLLLFCRTHYYIQLTLETPKSTRENIDIPIPFNVEYYEKEGLMYFDYRIKSLNVESLPRIPEKLNSIYLNNILEIQVDKI